MLLLRRTIHLLYGKCTLNPIPNELTLAKEVMKGGFRILIRKEIEAKKNAGSDKNQKKPPNTFVVVQSTGVATTPSSLAEFCLKMMSSQKRVKVEEDDDIMLRLPRSASFSLTRASWKVLWDPSYSQRMNATLAPLD